MTEHDELLRTLDRGGDDTMTEAAELIRKLEREAEAVPLLLEKCSEALQSLRDMRDHDFANGKIAGNVLYAIDKLGAALTKARGE